MRELKVTLPFPPSVNKMYGRRKNGMNYCLPKIKSYREEVFVRMCSSIRFHGALICIEMKIYPPNLRKWDLDNRIKVVLDALERAEIFINDSQVMRLFIEKGEVRKGGEIELIIREL